MELGSTGNYLRGGREQAHNFGDLGSPAKKQKNKEKPPFCLIFFKKSSASGGLENPLVNYRMSLFRTNILIYIDRREKYGDSVFLLAFLP